jgi:hypothetical protein
LSENGKREAIRAWASRGVVLLYMRGHIMLYLGEADGRDYAVSSIGEYRDHSRRGPETVRHVGEVAVTDLELGRGTDRRAFIERLATLVVFAPDAPASKSPGAADTEVRPVGGHLEPR